MAAIVYLAKLKMAQVALQVVFESLIKQPASLIITKAMTIFQKDQPLTVLTKDSTVGFALLTNHLFKPQPTAKVVLVIQLDYRASMLQH